MLQNKKTHSLTAVLPFLYSISLYLIDCNMPTVIQLFFLCLYLLNPTMVRGMCLFKRYIKYFLEYYNCCSGLHEYLGLGDFLLLLIPSMCKILKYFHHLFYEYKYIFRILDVKLINLYKRSMGNGLINWL